jgi:peptide chain release factor 1
MSAANDPNEPVLRKLREIEGRFLEIETKLQDPATITNRGLFASLARERGSLDRTVTLFRTYRDVERQRADAAQMAAAEADPELKALAEEETKTLAAKSVELIEALKDALVQADPEASKDCIVEIRAGTGGDEASLFAADLFRMYQRYAERRGFKVEIMDSSQSEVGGLKEIIFSLVGSGAFGTFRYESGGHRVQRVPTTETQGRIHTSLATVGVLPEAEEVDIAINPADLRVDTMAAGGPGGQHVNKTESAVRIVHIPTGIEVRCQDERSQHKNRAKAMRLLRSKLYEQEQEKRAKERGDLRRTLIGSGDRSERIRTYNFPQNRVTDHRVGITLYDLENVVEGDLDELMKALQEFDKAERLKNL